MKKLLSILLTAAMLFAMFTATSVVTLAADSNTPVVTEEKVEAGIFDGILDFFSDIISSILDLFTFEKELPDVSEWTDEDIIEYYKKAARKTRFVKADGFYAIEDAVLTGDYDNLEMKEYMDIYFESYCETLNSKKYTNIMGDYKKLTVSDCESIEAYTEGDYTVIELKLCDQYDFVDNAKDVITVSHAMNIGKLLDESTFPLRVLGMTMNMEDMYIETTDAVAKVKIDNRGKVQQGTWSCITYSGCGNSTASFGGVTLNINGTYSLKMPTTFTIGGGF